MFIAQGFKPNNEFWRYLLGSLAVIVASTIGQLPLFLALIIKRLNDNQSFPTDSKLVMEVLYTEMDSNLVLFLILLSFVFGLAALYFVVKYFHKQPFIEVTTARKTVDWNRIFFSFGIWAAFSIVSTVLFFYFKPENFVINFQLVPFIILFVIAVILIPVQTSLEEYLFRGYLMQGFGILAKNKWFPLLMTSIIFGGLHFFNPEVEKIGNIIMIYYIGTGLFLGILTLMDDGMELSLGFHAANNLTGALLVTADWSAFQTYSIFKDISEPTAGFDVIAPVFIIYPILLYIFSKKYNWSNWREKLTGKIELKDTNEFKKIGQYDQ